VCGWVVACAVLVLSCSHSLPTAPPISAHLWSDAEVLDYALVAREVAGLAPRSGVLGRHRGLTLLQTISYNDVCCLESDDFALIVHYELVKGTDCASVAGVSKGLRVPSGYSSSVRQFCFPKVLADHWPEVARKMSPDFRLAPGELEEIKMGTKK